MDDAELKKIYKKLLLKYHPDTTSLDIDDSIIKNIIESYKKIAQKSKNDDSKKNTPRQISYEKPLCYNDLKSFITKTLTSIASGSQLKESNSIIKFIEFVSANQDENSENNILLLSSFVPFFDDCSSNYIARYESTKRNFDRYISQILSCNNYFDKLSAINKNKDQILQDIITTLPKVESQHHKELLNSMIVISLAITPDVL